MIKKVKVSIELEMCIDSNAKETTKRLFNAQFRAIVHRMLKDVYIAAGVETDITNPERDARIGKLKVVEV